MYKKFLVNEGYSLLFFNKKVWSYLVRKKQMTKYKLLVKDVGDYSEDNLLKLFYIVIKHRFEHFLKGEGFRD